MTRVRYENKEIIVIITILLCEYSFFKLVQARIQVQRAGWKMSFRIVSLFSGFVVWLMLQAVRPSHGHGYLRTPPARNVLANSDYCPHCLNFGTVREVSENGSLRWPQGRRGICGDAYNGPRDHEWGGNYYGDGNPVVTYGRGGIAEIDIYLSTKYVVMRLYSAPFPSARTDLLEVADGMLSVIMEGFGSEFARCTRVLSKSRRRRS